MNCSNETNDYVDIIVLSLPEVYDFNYCKTFVEDENLVFSIQTC